MGLNQHCIKTFDKESWQKSTFEKLKKDLLCVNENRIVQYENYARNHLVMIYGKSQVGKTTLILNIIGVRDEYMEEVYSTLRAGVPHGNSSTSTAIVYARSENEDYGYAVASINELSSKNVFYSNKEEIIEKLKKTRKKLETGMQNLKDILFIYIPKRYFNSYMVNDTISIIDVPGVESRNQKEAIYAQNLLKKYLPVASVCMIVCRSNEIQSLESMVLPGYAYWKNMGHKFAVVITNSYNDGSVKKYFRESTNIESKDFFSFVEETYRNEVGHILGKDSQIQIFPIDIGDSFMKLTEELKKEDRKEVSRVKDEILKSLRGFIFKNNSGDRLHTALEDLKILIQSYEKEQKNDLEKDIKKLLNNKKIKENKIENINKKVLINLNQYKSEMNEEKQFFQKKRETLSEYTNKKLAGLSEIVKNYINEKSLFKEKKMRRCLKDKKKEVSIYIKNKIDDFLHDIFVEINDELEELYISVIISEEMPAYENYVDGQESKLYPSKEGLFSRKRTVYLSDVEEVCEIIQKLVNQRLQECISSKINYIEMLIEEKQKEIENVDRIYKHQVQSKTIIKDEINKIDNRIAELKEKKKVLADQSKQDKLILDTYLEYARDSYLEQRNQLVSLINSKCDTHEKMILLLLIGVLDKDYIRVTGDGR